MEIIVTNDRIVSGLREKWTIVTLAKTTGIFEEKQINESIHGKSPAKINKDWK